MKINIKKKHNIFIKIYNNVYFHCISEEPTLDITSMLKKKNYNVVDMFKKAEEFFVSIGWQKLPTLFWKKSMLVQPPDRNVTCYASAWDFGIKVNGEPDIRFVYYYKDSILFVVLTNGAATSCNYVS